MKRTKQNQTDLRPERKRLGASLFNLAVELSRQIHTTQKEIEQRIKTMKRRRKSVDGKSGMRWLREQVEAVSNQMVTNRHRREASRYQTGRRPPNLVGPGRKPVRLDQRPMEQRLRYLVETTALRSFRVLYRYDSAGQTDLEITKDPAQVGVTQSEYLDWDFYSKRTRYPKKIVNTTITVPNAWRIRVLKQDLAEVDGLMTLDAQRLEGAPAGVELFAAVWIEQGRGYALHTRHGYIARNATIGTTYHADSVDRAIKGLARKTGVKVA